MASSAICQLYTSGAIGPRYLKDTISRSRLSQGVSELQESFEPPHPLSWRERQAFFDLPEVNHARFIHRGIIRKVDSLLVCLVSHRAIIPFRVPMGVAT